MDTMVIATACTQITRWLTQTTLTGEVLEVKCHCAKISKNARGLKVHKPRTTCGSEEKQVQHIMETLSEPQEDSSQDAPHSTGNLSASAPPQSQRRDSPNTTSGTHPTREKVKRPQGNDNTAWNQSLEPKVHIGRNSGKENRMYV